MYVYTNTLIHSSGSADMKIDYDNRNPIYVQILDYIKNRMVSGELKAGQRLPSIRDLADELEVTPNTIQRVYRELEYEKLSYTERGNGSFITRDSSTIENLKQILIREEVARFYMQMRRFGLTDGQIFQFIRNFKEGK